MKNLKISTKIVAAFVSVILLSASMGYMIWIRTDNLIGASNLIEHAALPSLNSTAKLKFSISSVRRLESQMLISGAPDEEKERISLIERIEKLKVESISHLKALEDSVGGDDDAAQKYKNLLSTSRKKSKSISQKLQRLLIQLKPTT